MTVRDQAKQIVGSIWRIISRFCRWWTPVRKAGGAMLVGALLVGRCNYLNQRELCYLPETLRRIVVAFDNSATIELLSLALTIFVVDELYHRRETEREKRRLILQMGSPDNAFAREAVRALRTQSWLNDGSLKGANLWEADLRKADLVGANLQDANLAGANLQEAKLISASLQAAWLVGANLQEANLEHANLQKADLRSACLQEGKLRGAYLQDANLAGTNLQAANLTDANLQAAVLISVKLQGTNLWRAKLQEANLREAEYNNDTRWPEGFTPPPEAINVDAETGVED